MLSDILDLFQRQRQCEVLGHCCCRRVSRTMKPIIRALLEFLSTEFRSRHFPQVEIVALLYQLAVYQRTTCPNQFFVSELLVRVFFGGKLANGGSPSPCLCPEPLQGIQIKSVNLCALEVGYRYIMFPYVEL